MAAQKKQFYVTKWCLSQGVFKITGAIDSTGMHVIQVLDEKSKKDNARIPLFLKLNKDVFESAADAYNRAIQIAEAREKGLKKQMERVAEKRRTWEGQC